MTIITLNDIRAKRPCASGWATLTKALGTTERTTELSIGDIVIANGLDAALWALRCLPPREAVAAVMPAVKRASKYTADQRVHECIAAVDRWIAGDDSVDLKGAARAARTACEEAWAEAERTARTERTAQAAARTAEAAAKAEAAKAATWAAARAAAWEAWAAERDMQASDLLVMFPPIRLKAKVAA